MSAPNPPNPKTDTPPNPISNTHLVPDPNLHPAESPSAGRPRLELSPIKIAAGAVAAASAAAIGSTLGVAGTIAGAAVASVISASASALISHSLERGKDVALKALPVYGHLTGDLPRARFPRDPGAPLPGPDRVPQSRGWATDAATTDGLPTDQPPTNDAQIDAATARALASTLRFPGRPTDETTVLPAISARNTRDAETVVLPRSNAAGSDASAAAKRPSWKEQLPGWKSVAVVTALSFVVGTGAMAGVELLRGHGVIGTNGSVFSNGGGGKQEQHPSPMTPGGHGSGGTGSSPSTPSTPTPSGATTPSQTPSTTPSTPSTDTPSTTPSTDPTTPSTTPDTTPAPPTGTDAPSTPGNANSSAPAAGKPSGTTAPVS